MPWELRPANFSQNESSHQDPNDVILDSLIKNFEQLVWFDFVGLAYQFCLVVFGTFLNGILLWVLCHAGPPTLADLAQIHMAAFDLLSAVVNSLLLLVARGVIMRNVVEGIRVYAYHILVHATTICFEDIATIIISGIRFKQVCCCDYNPRGWLIMTFF